MTVALRLIVVALSLAACQGVKLRASSQVQAQAQANPIRKVVTLLQAMQSKVTAEGEKEKELYEKFMCYCKTGTADLAAAISAAEAKGPSVTSEIEAGEGKLEQAKADLKQSQVDRSAAEAAISQATALREKEAAAYAATKSEYETNIAAMKKAVAALALNQGGSFLQTPAAQTIRRVVESSDHVIEADAQDVLSFLSGGASSEGSGEIEGILKQMIDTMTATLDDATKTETGAISSYEGLVAAKKKEIAALTATIEAKTTQIGELGVELVAMKEDLDDTTKTLVQDKKFLAELEKGCATKTGEWEERKKIRAEELVALADTIKMLNDDDALDLFKKTLPSASASLLQMKESDASMRGRALNDIRALIKGLPKKDRAGLQFIALALSGKKALGRGGFDKVVKMIDDMVALLKTEQLDDDHKKEYCEAQFDQAEDKKKGLERSVSDLEKLMATSKETIATLTEEIATLEAGIKELDKSVAEATENRKLENEEYKALIASDTAAKELLKMAKNRLNKFYNPKLYKPPPKVELSAEDKIVENMSFLQVVARKGAPPPPPETFGAYTKKSEESSGVIAMMDLLLKDLDKEMTEAEVEEKDAQADYEAAMSDSAAKRSTDLKATSDKTSAKADMEMQLEQATADKGAVVKELMATEKYIASLHGECDWLMQYFDVRKEARTGEIDALMKAKDVLNGADYSLLQILRRAF